MSQNKFFYVILGSGKIYEFPYSEERLRMAMEAWKEKGLFSIQGYGAAISGSYFSEVLNEAQYRDHIAQMTPKEYVQNGAWYNKRGEFIRYAAWKQEIKDAEKAKLVPAPAREDIEPRKLSDKTKNWLKEKYPEVYAKTILKTE